ncbi:MAG: nodulation competitiveness protein nfeD [Thermoleophilia bacterium]|nr:nodulation competitiveness protein nfeD [Thermoleophilia bacterium]
MRLLRDPIGTCLAMLAAIAAASCLLAGAAQAADDRPTRVPRTGDGRVLVAPLTGAVDPVMLEFATRVLKRGERDDFDAVMFELDTPGGLSTSMDDIVRAIVASDLPVYVYVSPGGGRAASAGVFITYAADVAAMAPGTNIGSATPISGGGGELPKDLRRKVINDAVAKVTELARERDRDPAFAEAAIREAENIGAREALRRDVVEYVENDVRAVLDASDGTTLEPKGLTVRLGDASIERMDVPLTLRVLKRIVDPNLLFLLFGAGIIGLMFELTHPGVVAPGVVGVICLLLALFGLSVLPASGAGIALLLLAAALFVGEGLAPGGGILGAGGAAALLIGGLLLFDDSSGYGVSRVLAIGMAIALGAFVLGIARAAWHARRLGSSTGGGELVGQLGTVRRPIAAGAAGSVYVDGELWQARSDAPIDAGARVEVLGVDSLQLRVTPTSTPGAPPE